MKNRCPQADIIAQDMKLWYQINTYIKKNNGRYYNKNMDIIYNVMLIQFWIILIAASLFTLYVAVAVRNVIGVITVYCSL